MKKRMILSTISMASIMACASKQALTPQAAEAEATAPAAEEAPDETTPAPSPAPLEVSGEPIVSDTVEEAEIDTNTQGIIKSVVKLRRSNIIDCYNLELGKDPTLAGRVIVTFDIEDGKAVGVDAETSMGSGIQSCIESRVKSWNFSGVDEAFGIELSYNLQPN